MGIWKKSFATVMALFLFLGACMVAVTPAGADSRVLDLYVDSAVLSDPTPAWKDNITVTITIGNAGDEDCTNASVAVEAVNGTQNLDLGTYLLGTDNGGADITAGGTQNLDVYFDSDLKGADPDKEYTITITVTNATDANTANDTLDVMVTFEGANVKIVDWDTDAMVIPIVDIAYVLIGIDMPTIFVDVQNFGAGPIDDEVVELTLTTMSQGTLVNTWIQVNLTGAAGAKETDTLEWVWDTSSYAEGFYIFSAEVIGTGNTSEYGVMFMLVEPVSNLLIDPFDYTPASPVVTDEVNITATVVNDDWGDIDAENVVVNWILDEGTTPVKTYNFATIALGDGEDMFYVWDTTNAAEGEHNITFEIISDTEETYYDSYYITLGPKPVPVLEILGVTYGTPAVLDEPDDTQTMDVTVSVKNTGTADAVLDTVKLFIDTTEYVNDTVNITMGATVDLVFTVTLTTKENDYDVEVNATAPAYDSFNSTTLTIPGDKDMAEIVIDAVTYGTTVEQEDAFDITVKISNAGDATQAGPIEVKVMMGSTEIDTVEFADLAAGESNDTTLEWTPSQLITVGTHNISAVYGTVELVGANFTVTAYKYPILGISFEKKKDKVKKYTGEGAEGDKVKFKVNLIVENTGTAAATNLVVKLFDSKLKELGNATISSLAAGGNTTVTIEVKMAAGKSTGPMLGQVEGTFDGLPLLAITLELSKISVGKTPGFEAVVFVAAVAVAVVLLGRRKRK